MTTQTHISVELWTAPSSKGSGGVRYSFDAEEVSATDTETVCLGAMDRAGCGIGTILLFAGSQSGSCFVSVDDAERFASAVLTVCQMKREQIRGKKR